MQECLSSSIEISKVISVFVAVLNLTVLLDVEKDFQYKRTLLSFCFVLAANV